MSVRQAGGLTAEDIGVSLMRKAFQPESGPLADRARLKAEQQALSDRFAGAVGSHKNPHSHPRVPIEAVEAVEMIVLASHLLGILDKHDVQLAAR